MVAKRKQDTKQTEPEQIDDGSFDLDEWQPPEGVQLLTREEGRAIFDQRAREWLGISGEEFVRRWDAGEIEDPDRPGVIDLLGLLPLARR